MAHSSAKDPIRDIPKYFRIFQAYIGRRMYLIFLLTLSASLAEGLGIVMLLPLLKGIDSNGSEADSFIGNAAENLLGVFGWADSAIAIIVLITIAFLAKGLLIFGARSLVVYFKAQLLRELKGQLFDAYRQMDLRYYASRDTGHFINVINQQINGTLRAFEGLIGLGSQLITTLVYVVIAFLLAWRFGLMALVIGLILLLLFRSLNIYVRKLSRRSAVEQGHLNKLLVQFLHAYKYLVATDQAPHLRNSVMKSVRRLTGYQWRQGVAKTFTSSVREPLAVVAIMGIVLVQLALLDQPLAPILVSILLFYRGLSTTLQIQGSYQAMLSSIGAVEVVNQEFLDQRENREPNGSVNLPPLTQGIELRNVYFRYSRELGDVLRGVSLTIPVRTSVAFVGESGAGKSTLVDLLTLMLKPRAGQVLIDGVPGETIDLQSWRRQIGYVSQEEVVFDDTIANNISMWEGDPTRDSQLLERIRVAARKANIAAFVEGLPNGYLTLVGDRGVRLSGGQRQRLFIARELFREPNLLILDEATSALDSDSERYIQKSIDALKGRITVVIIAHRLSTIRNVDQVFVFDKGRLIESGAYHELRDSDHSTLGRLIEAQAL
jgi:subfamily B ATP-binding cassette protein MsbA